MIQEIPEATTSQPYLPPGYILQPGRVDFKFDIIAHSRTFRRHVAESLKADLFRDICDDSLSELSPDEIRDLPTDRYQNIVQKSPTWLTLRSLAQGTASSVGKYIKGPATYPTLENIREAWVDKLQKKPFQKTHTMTGHMNWGVGYEDPALLHFAMNQGVSVTQVGTIRLDLSEILELGQKYYGGEDLSGDLTVSDVHLLISPDGMVGRPEPEGDHQRPGTVMQRELLGMLEIKCISPFHHVEVDGYLEWVSDMETRQWYSPYEIPFVYVMQIGLQALVGVTQYGMNEDHKMWFVRWSPHGLSKFTVKFGPLLRLGVAGGLLYLSLVERIKTEEDLDDLFPYHRESEKIYYKHLCSSYEETMKAMVHEYVPIEDYPEFDLYRECTEYYRFKVGEIDFTQLQTFPTNKDSAPIAEEPEDDLDSCIC